VGGKSLEAQLSDHKHVCLRKGKHTESGRTLIRSKETWGKNWAANKKAREMHPLNWVDWRACNGRKHEPLTFSLFRLGLKFLLPSATFGRAVKFNDFGKGNDEFISYLGHHAPTSKISAQPFDQIVKAKENAPY
jgi:hypothetical protein